MIYDRYMITTLLFDADGVLIQAERFSKQLARKYPVDESQVAEFFTGPFVDKCLVGKGDLKELIRPYLKGFGWPGTADELLEFWFKAEHKLDEDLIAYIQKLRAQGITAVVATNNERHRAQYMLEKMGFADSFDKLYASGHLGHVKPAMEFFAHVVADLGVPKSEVLLWDDDKANIQGAKQYGIHAEFYQGYAQFVATMKNYSL